MNRSVSQFQSAVKYPLTISLLWWDFTENLAFMQPIYVCLLGSDMAALSLRLWSLPADGMSFTRCVM